MFIYLYLTDLPDTFFLKIIYFLGGKETDLTVLLESTIATEYKKWCSYETNTALCRDCFFFLFIFFIMSHILGTFDAQYKILNMVYLNFSNNVINSLIFSIIACLNIIQFSPSTHNRMSRITCSLHTLTVP